MRKGVMSVKFKALAAVFFVFFLVSAATAHPPREIRLSYDGKDELTVRVFHGVDDGSKHFIEKIEVRVDGTVVAERHYSSQPGPEGLSEIFSLGRLLPGMEIRVKAQCNIFGSLEATYTVP